MQSYEQIAKKIVNESSEIINNNQGYFRRRIARNRIVEDDFEIQVNDIYSGLVLGMTRRLMKKHERPSGGFNGGYNYKYQKPSRR